MKALIRSRPRHVLSLLSFFAVLLVLRLAIQIIDPWKISAETYSVSANAVVNIAAPFYRHAFGENDADEAGSLLSTIVLSDADLLRLGETYPPSYEAQMGLLFDILDSANVDGSGGKPLAVFLDFTYLDARPGIDLFEQQLRWMALNKTLAGQALADQPSGETVSQPLYPPITSSGPGLLTMQSDPPMFRRTLSDLPTMDRRDLLSLPAASSWIVGDPARYALAPQGWMSPAIRLALWSCASLPRAATRFATCRGEGPLKVKDVRNAAHAAAARSTALSCASLAKAGKASIADATLTSIPPTIVENLKRLKDDCETIGLDHAATAGWAPAPPGNNAPEGSPTWVRDRFASYAIARRDGKFEGAKLGTECFTDLAAVLTRPIDMTVLTEALEDNAVNCNAWAEKLQDQAYGPSMQVFWGAGPQDGGPLRVGSRAQSATGSGDDRSRLPAPHDKAFPDPRETIAKHLGRPGPPFSWAIVDDRPVIDPCRGFRFGARRSDAFYEAGLRTYIEAFGDSETWVSRRLGSTPKIDTCSYHRNLAAPWLKLPQSAVDTSGNTSDIQTPKIVGWHRTMHYAHEATAGKVVMIAASVEGARDMHEARGIRVPGVWIHAMALDNILTLGKNYRKASFDPLGFDDSFPFYVKRSLYEMLAAAIVLLFYRFSGAHRMLQRWFDNVRKVGLDPAFLRKIISAGLMNFISCAIFLPFAILLYLCTDAPIFDWISACAIVMVGVGLMSDDPGRAEQQERAADTNIDVQT